MALTSLNHLDEILLSLSLSFRVYRYGDRGDCPYIITTAIRTNYHLGRIVLSWLNWVLLCGSGGRWLLSVRRRRLVFWNRPSTSGSPWHVDAHPQIWIPQEGDISRSDSPPLNCLLSWLRGPHRVPSLILSGLARVICIYSSVWCLFLWWANLLFRRPANRNDELWYTWINRGRYVYSFLHLLIRL